LPDGDERRVLELGLRTLLGANLLAVRGYTAPEVSANCASSLALLAGVEDSPQVRPVVWALWLYHLVLSDRDTTRELAAQFQDAAERDDDDEARCRAHITNAITTYWQGDFERTRQHAAEARACYRSEMRLKVPQYGDDSGPYGHIYEAMALWFQGRPDHARLWIEKGLAVARETNYAFTIAAALSFATQPSSSAGCRGDRGAGRAHDRLLSRAGLPPTAQRSHRGSAPRRGTPHGARDLVTASRSIARRVPNVNYLLAPAAEGYPLAGIAPGDRAADEGLALAAEHLDTYSSPSYIEFGGALLPSQPISTPRRPRSDSSRRTRRTLPSSPCARPSVSGGYSASAAGRPRPTRLAEHVARSREAGHRPDRWTRRPLAALG
jgi:hypothetical protein